MINNITVQYPLIYKLYSCWQEIANQEITEYLDHLMDVYCSLVSYTKSIDMLKKYLRCEKKVKPSRQHQLAFIHTLD